MRRLMNLSASWSGLTVAWRSVAPTPLWTASGMYPQGWMISMRACDVVSDLSLAGRGEGAGSEARKFSLPFGHN